MSVTGKIEYNCALCNEPDSDMMVQCDLCDKWLHFTCAKVQEDVESSDFVCDKCTLANNINNGAPNPNVKSATYEKPKSKDVVMKTPGQLDASESNSSSLKTVKEIITAEIHKSPADLGSRKVKSQTSNVSSNRAKSQRLLKIMDEEREVAKKREEESKERDRLYFEQKRKIIEDMDDEESLSSEFKEDLVISKRESVANWASDQQRRQKVLFDKNKDKLGPENIIQDQRKAECKNPFVPPPRSEHRLEIRSDLPWLSANNQREFLNESSLQSAAIQNGESGFADSIKRIASRHMYDLPNFSGSPSEWPMFMSSYMRSTQALNLSNFDNLGRLQKCLKGDALKLVRSFLVYEQSVPRAIDALRMRFGRPEIVLNEMIHQAKLVPKINIEKMETVLDLSLAVQHLCVTMVASGMSDHLNNPILLQELLEKLPGAQKLEWASYKLKYDVVNLSTFDNWLRELADRACTVMSNESNPYRKPEEKSGRRFATRSQEYVHAVHTGDSIGKKTETKSANQCSLCNKEHSLDKCPLFKGKSIDERWSVIKTHDACRKCLIKHHWKSCRSMAKCGINGCFFKHHPLLHDPVRHANVNQASTDSNPTQNVVAVHSIPGQLLFRIVPVTLYGPSTSINTFAFLDDGSTRTLLDDEIAKLLNIDGPTESLHLKWTGDIKREEKNSRLLSLQISGVGEFCDKYLMSNVRTVSSLDLVSQSLHFDPRRTQYRHLRNLPISSYHNARPQILIGLEHWQLALPLEVKEGQWGEPVACKTRLGWVAHGAYQAKSDPVDSQYNFHAVHSTPDELLHAQVKEFFSIENFGVKALEKTLESRDDERARDILRTTTKKLETRYETGLLWRYDEVEFPESFPMAMKRLQCLEKKLAKTPEVKNNIRNQIQNYVNSGYARKLSPDEVNKKTPRTWYLPLFTVVNPNKPSKVRMVWDAAATVNGVSLNSMLLKGPDLLCSLPDIIYRFREKRVALAGDIKEMYHQVAIRAEDQDSQRFLWRDNPNDNPEVFVMQVMTFGSTCSPCAAHYIKNTNALQYSDKSPRAVEAICQNHYVDDWLDSFNTEQEACEVAEEVSRIHSSAGFIIRNWVSNSPFVLSQLGAQHDSQNNKNLNMSNESDASKVLGMWWDTKSDTFYYALNFSRLDPDILNGIRRPSKREVLRTLMMVFDPLGLIASFLVYVKMLLQEIWRSEIDWDQHVNDVQYGKWLKWVNMLPKIQDIRVARCYIGDNYDSVQLHVFVDASDSAYAAVAYFRLQTLNGVKCCIVSAKTKVAPLQAMSIPRLELQAAVLGARLSNSIVSGHSMKPDRIVLWSDSIDVLSWLRSDKRKYRQFVAFRVGEILETTNLSSWRWVPTKENVADDATKWSKDQPNFSSSSRWYTSPDFLYSPEEMWPTEPQRNFNTAEEAMPQMSHIVIQPNMFTFIIEKYSKWRRAYRTTAWLLRYVNNLNRKKPKMTGVLTREEIRQAKSKLYRQAQLEEYRQEIALLEQNPNQSVDKSSSLYQSSPFLDDLKVLRMKGRTRRANYLSFDAINPVLLPRRHRVTQLIVTYYHEKYLHCHRESVINELRQIYVIPQLRVVLNQINTNCQHCKNARAAPNPPEMAEHPQARLAAFARPFSYVGVDYFGPIEVVVGRRVEKRWGCLFTCLTVRAIHIEIAHSLSKESCMMCIRNFIARRGMPIEIRTDNGTNFIGVRNELKKLVHQIPLDEIKSHFDEIQWILNPPLAPHMGGCWERQVQSVKKCLELKMHMKRPDDENLRCYMMEVESMINSRPLTYLPITPDDPEAITPNHFLIGSSGGIKPFCEFDDDVTIVKKNYVLSQQMALRFWKRWLREYLPTLTRRTRWFKKIKPIEVGDVVVIVDENKRSSWAKGVIIETLTSRNSDQVRQVVVKTKNGIYTRPATKIAVLDIESENSKQKHF